MELERYNPRKDREALIELVSAFDYRAFKPIILDNFTKELDTRVKDLKMRNSIVLAKEGENLLGAGFFTVFVNHFGETQCQVHQVVTRKENSFRKGIEEQIMRELFKYIKSTMGINQIFLFCDKSDNNFKSLLMKMGIKKSPLEYYEHTLD